MPIIWALLNRLFRIRISSFVLEPRKFYFQPPLTSGDYLWKAHFFALLSKIDMLIHSYSIYSFQPREPNLIAVNLGGS